MLTFVHYGSVLAKPSPSAFLFVEKSELPTFTVLIEPKHSSAFCCFLHSLGHNLITYFNFFKRFCPPMEGIQCAATDCLFGSHTNQPGLESVERHIENSGLPFVPQVGHPTTEEIPSQHALSDSQDTCWAPSWGHSCQNTENGAPDYAASKLQWHLKTSVWDFNMSAHTGPGSDVIRRTDANDWGTQEEGFILEGATIETPHKGLFSTCSALSNGSTSHFCTSPGFPTLAVPGVNGLLGSSCSQSDSEVKPCKSWLEQDSELNIFNFESTNSKVENGRIYLENDQKDDSNGIRVNEVKLGDAKDIQSCTLRRTPVTPGDPSMGLRLGRTYFEDAGEGGTTRGRTASTLPVFTGSPGVKKQRILAPGVHVPGCQVEGCKADLSTAKDYHRRHKVCEKHSKEPKVIANGMEQRFCQQCSRFHDLGEFDDSKRSCRRRLAGHNERRRKSSQDASIVAAASVCQDPRSALSAILDRSCFMQHPMAASSMLNEPDTRRGWPATYEKLEQQVSLARPMQVLNGGLSIPRHASDRLLMMLQGPKSLMVPRSKDSSSPEMHHHLHLYGQPTSSIEQGLTLSPSRGPGMLPSSISSPGLSAESGRALSLLSSQSLSSRSNAEKFMDDNHHSLSQEFANSHTCGTTAQSGFVASGGEKLFGSSSTGVDNKEEDHASTLIDPMLAQLLQGQDLRNLNSQQIRPTLDLMQLPSHSHHTGIQDGNAGAAFPALHSLRPYETSIFGPHQQLI